MKGDKESLNVSVSAGVALFRILGIWHTLIWGLVIRLEKKGGCNHATFWFDRVSDRGVV
jgi:hypothetical protein